MSAEILMPSLDASINEVMLVKWLKAKGDQVNVGEVVAEVETDKAIIEVESQVKGIFIKALVEEGQFVAVNSAIALVEEEGECSGSLKEIAKSVANSGRRIFASPLARRITLQKGLDLLQVSGSGPNGRIVKCDVENALADGALEKTGTATKSAAADSAEFACLPGYLTINNSAMRNTIARRLAESSRNVPHYFLTIDCNLDKLLALRKEINSEFDAERSVSLNDFFLRASAIALKKVPDANAAWTDRAVLQFERADISIAVATDGGLITPVIRHADAKSLIQISEETRSLTARARAGRLLPDEYKGGTFTISNLGMYGIKSFTSIINTPQGAILSVGAAEQRPVVTDGQIGIATLMTVTLAADHRCIDGAVGAQFLAAFKRLLERPLTMLFQGIF